MSNKILDISSEPESTFLQSKKAHKTQEYRGKSTIFRLPVSHPLRLRCILLVEHRYFDRFILGTIVLNCFVLALEVSWTEQLQNDVLFFYLELLSQSIFSLEMIIKIIAEGFILNGQGSYIFDHWNKLDFVVVIFGFSAFIPTSMTTNAGGFKALRALRVLRPLRAVSMFPDLQLLVISVIRSFSMMTDVLFLTVTFLFLFGIVGVELFGGAFHQRCYDLPTIENGYTKPMLNTTREFLCGGTDPEFDCDIGQVCLAQAQNPTHGIIGFDNVGQAWLNIFTSMTLEGWADISYYTFESSSYAGGIYFLFVVLALSFFISQLITSVVFTSYTTALKEEKEKAYQRELAKDLSADENVSPQCHVEFLSARDLWLGGRKIVSPYIKFTTISYRNQPINTYISKHIHETRNPEWSDAKFPLYLPEKVSCLDIEVLTENSDTSHTDVVLGALRIPLDLKTNMFEGFVELRDPNNKADYEHNDDDNDDNSRRTSFSGFGSLLKTPSMINRLSNNIKRLSRLNFRNNDTDDNFRGILQMKLTYAHTPEERQALIDSEHKKEKLKKLQLKMLSARAELEQAFKGDRQLSKIIHKVSKKTKTDNDNEQNFLSRVASASIYSPQASSAAKAYLHDEEEHDWEVVAITQHFIARKCFLIVTHPYFSTFGMLMIILNTIFLMSEHYEQPDWWTIALDGLNIFFTVFFTIELIMKMIGLDFATFVRDKFNLFDVVVVLCALIELICVKLDLFEAAGLSVLRSLRLFRVFKVATSWNTLRRVLTVIVDAMNSLLYFSLLLVLYHFVVGLIGVQLLAGHMKINNEGDIARYNYEHLGWAVVTTFQVISGENWNEVMYVGIYNSGWIASVYFLVVFISGNFIVLNLFLAILIQKYNDAQGDDEGDIDNKVEKAGEAEEQRRIDLAHSLDPDTHPFDEVEEFKVNEEYDNDNDNKNINNDEKILVIHHSNLSEDENEDNNDNITSPVTDVLQDKKDKNEDEKDENEDKKDEDEDEQQHEDPLAAPPTVPEHPFGIADTDELEETDDTATATEKHSKIQIVETNSIHNQRKKMFDNEQEQEEDDNDNNNIIRRDSSIIWSKMINPFVEKPRPSDYIITGKSLYIFDKNNIIRQLFLKIVSHIAFEATIMIFIALTMLFLALDAPILDPKSNLKQAIDIFNLISSLIFVIEAILKIVVLGFIQSPHSYLRDNWNRLDFVIVLISVVDFIPSLSLESLKILRGARSLRPLKVIHKFPSLKIVINAMLNSIPGILHVLLVSSLFFIIFATLGIFLFSGQFYWCMNIVTGEVDNTLNRMDCAGAGIDYQWENPSFGSFDNIFEAILVLFQVSSMEMWPDVLYRAVDISGVGNAPIRDNHQMVSIFFVIYIVVTSFFAIQLISGVVVDNFQIMFHKLREEENMKKKYLIAHEKQKKKEAVKKKKNRKKSKDKQSSQEIEMDVVYEMKKQQQEQREGKKHSSSDEGLFRIPTQPWRLKVYEKVNAVEFEVLITIVIFINIMSMAFNFYGMSNTFALVLNIINWVCVGFYVIEFIMKFTAYGTDYFKSKWNWVDFFVITAAIAQLWLKMLQSKAWLVVRVFRVAKVIRIFESYRVFRAFDRLIVTIQHTLPALMAVGFLLFLLNFIYACVGMSLFSFTPYGDFINYNVNFDTFGVAIFTMFRGATGESWNGIMNELRPRENCEPSPTVNCGSIWAPPFWVTFVIISQWLVIQLIIAVVLSQYELLSLEDDEVREANIKKAIAVKMPVVRNNSEMVEFELKRTASKKVDQLQDIYEAYDEEEKELI